MGLSRSLKEIAVIMNRLAGRGVVKGYALIGGLSVSAWGVPRGTMDIDLLVSAGPPDNIKAFCTELEAEGFAANVHRGGIADPVPCLVRTQLKGVPIDIIVATPQSVGSDSRNSQRA